MTLCTLEPSVAPATPKTSLQDKRTPCEVYTRVMGYFRPVSHFNRGKKSEFYGRTYFNEACSTNSQFIKDYTSSKDVSC